MRDVDLLDQNIQYYGYAHKSKKFGYFRNTLTKELLEARKEKTINYTEIIIYSHFIEFDSTRYFVSSFIHDIIAGEKIRKCVLCKILRRSANILTFYICSQCQVNLCPKCL